MSNYLRRLGRSTAVFNWVCLGLMIGFNLLGLPTTISTGLFVVQLLATAHYFIRLYLELKRDEKRPIS